jgi:hypothetical protein
MEILIWVAALNLVAWIVCEAVEIRRQRQS